METSTLKPSVNPLHNAASLPQTVDVAIVGGGPAGLATALSLANAGIDSVIIERSDYNHPRIGEHLTPEGVSCLQQLGLWTESFISQHQLCYGVKSAWGGTEIAHSDYLFHPFGCGVNLTRPAFDIVFANLAQQQGVPILLDSRLSAAQKDGQGWSLSLVTPSGSQQIKTKFIVDASGRGAVFAKRQGQTLHHQDLLIGMVAYLQQGNLYGQQSEDKVQLESSEFGWWYFAQLKDNRIVCLHMTDSDLISTGNHGHLKTWHERLQATQYFQNLSCWYDSVKKILIKSAHSHCLSQITGDDWLAVGDAAMSFDPLSSMGITKGIKHGILAGQAISQYLEGSLSALKHYETERKREFYQYLEMRSAYYRMENRWPNSRFWQRRQKTAII